MRRTGRITHEVVYLLTMHPPHLACPERLLELMRGHWDIENSLHYVRDVTFGEDRSQLHTGNAPQIMVALRKLVITRYMLYSSFASPSSALSVGVFPSRRASV